jgi:Protein of unknown function (DUF4232)
MKVGNVVRTAAAAAAIAGGLAVGPGGTARWTGGTALAASPPCANYQLAMQPISSNGAMGHISEMYRIHDLLPGSCTLFGYPGAVQLGQNFHTLPTHVTRGPWPTGGPTPVLVTLDRSHNAYFVLGWEHFPTPGQKCPIAWYLMITAPNDRLPVVVNAGSGGIMACGGNLTASQVSAKRFWT